MAGIGAELPASPRPNWSGVAPNQLFAAGTQDWPGGWSLARISKFLYGGNRSVAFRRLRSLGRAKFPCMSRVTTVIASSSVRKIPVPSSAGNGADPDAGKPF